MLGQHLLPLSFLFAGYADLRKSITEKLGEYPGEYYLNS